MAKVAAASRDAFIEARRAQFLDAALRLFALHGFDATTVEDIAREVGVSKGAMYLYFPTKDNLLEALVQRYSPLAEAPDFLRSISSLPPEKAIAALVRESWQWLKQRGEPMRLLLQMPFHPENARLLMERVILPVNQLVAGYLRSQIKQGRFRNLDPLLAARCLFGMLEVFFLTQELLGGNRLFPLSDDQITATVTDLFLNGALKRPVLKAVRRTGR